MNTNKKFYITTAIAYASQKPHIGNSYEIVLTDAIARYKRQMGYDVFFLTGTDEHGQKVESLASKNGVSPKEYVDSVAAEVRRLDDLLGASYDKFIRTTDDYHQRAVQKMFKQLYEQDDIYKGAYEGMYCTPCESFWTENQLDDGKCPDCGREVVAAKEEAYFLRLTKYQDWLIKHIEDNPDFIVPESRKNEMLGNFLRPGLQDLCVSRTSFKWGIPVDFDSNHVVYVWLDALSNYITAIGYDPDGSSDQFNHYWPCDVHIIGKDILRFHTIYWPIMLKALNVPLPKQIFGHPWFMFGSDKMSKSRGNVMYADELVELFGLDAVRYYLLSAMPYASDGSISYNEIIECFNSDLANTLGNLVNRTVAMSNKYFDGKVTNTNVSEALDSELSELSFKTVSIVQASMGKFKTSDALEAIINLAKRSNKYIDETTPWVLAKDEASLPRLQTVLYNLIESIRFIAVLLTPFMPDTAKSILTQINCNVSDIDTLGSFTGYVSGSSVGIGTPLFNRIDTVKKLAEIEASHNAAAQS